MSGPACDHLQGMATPHPALRVAPDQLAAGAPGKGSDVATDAPALTLLLALASAFAFACAMIASNVGLRHMSARAGVTVSVPSAAVLFWLALPAFIDPALAAAPISALGIFLAIGLFCTVCIPRAGSVGHRRSEALQPSAFSCALSSSKLRLRYSWI